VDVRCSDPGFCFPARLAPSKQLDFDGIGTFSNVGKGNKAPVFEINAPNVIPEPANQKSAFTFHWFEVNIDDLGEPGRLNIGAPNSVDCPGRGFGEKSAGPFVPDPVNDPGTTIILPFTELANCRFTRPPDMIVSWWLHPILGNGCKKKKGRIFALSFSFRQLCL
jgi:hypothetical protein